MCSKSERGTRSRIIMVEPGLSRGLHHINKFSNPPGSKAFPAAFFCSQRFGWEWRQLGMEEVFGGLVGTRAEQVEEYAGPPSSVTRVLALFYLMAVQVC